MKSKKIRILLLCNSNAISNLENGGSLRVKTLLNFIQRNFDSKIEIVTRVKRQNFFASYDLIVCVSFINAFKSLFIFKRKNSLVWFDFCDSFLLLNKFYFKHSKSLKTFFRIIRDFSLRIILPQTHLLTYITENDLQKDILKPRFKFEYVFPNEYEMFKLNFADAKHSLMREKSIFFVGNGNYLPNKVAVKWICESVMPKLTETIGVQKKLLVFGLGFESFKSEFMVSQGYIQNLNSLIHPNDINFAYSLTEAGMKNKVLFGLTNGIVTLGSPEAFSGIHDENANSFVASSAEVFVAKLAELLASNESMRSPARIVFQRDDSESILRYIRDTIPA
jgi:hypothetical protein